MYFGTRIPPHLVMQSIAEGRRDEIIRLVQLVEEAGFEFIGEGDHMVDIGVAHFGQQQEKVVYVDPFSILSFYAAITSRLRLVTAVLVMPYRQPIAVAHAVATADRLSGGRLVLGAGVGYAKAEFRAMGIPLDERGPRTDEYLDIIDALLREEKVTFHGRYFSFDDVSLLFRGLQRPRPPFWIGGTGRRALERAILRGDGWMPLISGYPRAGRKAIRVSLTPADLADDLAHANERRSVLDKPPLKVVPSAGTVLQFSNGIGNCSGSDPWRCTLGDQVGTPQQLIEHLTAYREAGAEGVSLGIRASSIEECYRTIDIFANKVMPMMS